MIRRANLTGGFRSIIITDFPPICWNMYGQLDNEAIVRVADNLHVDLDS